MMIHVIKNKCTKNNKGMEISPYTTLVVRRSAAQQEACLRVFVEGHAMHNAHIAIYRLNYHLSVAQARLFLST